MVHVFKNGERSTAKNYCPFSLLSKATKAFEILVTNSLVDHLEKCGLLISSMLLGLLSSQLTSSLLTVIPDRIARPLTRSMPAQL